MRHLPTIALLSLLSLVSCGEGTVEVKVANETGEDLGTRVVELNAAEILGKLDSKGFFITDFYGNEIPSQLTHDSLILFACNIEAGGSQIFKIHKSDSIHNYPSTVWGAFYPKRRDDLSYENELVGFRIYGPGTQQAGEKAFGYDLFFKYPTEELIVPQLYAPETDDAVWAKVDSLRKIDNNLAEEYIKTFSYHLDHGKGMDCYAVGPTLGAGVAAIMQNDSIVYPWCYNTAEILDNGPLRFTAVLKFAPVKINSSEVTEVRKISLDSYSYLNNCEVRYEGLSNQVEIVAGFPLRDDSKPVVSTKDGLVAYADPTQGDTNGKALLGIKTKTASDSSLEKDKHILLSYTLKPGNPFIYKWGFSWDKTEIPTMDEWVKYLEKADLQYSVMIK